MVSISIHNVLLYCTVPTPGVSVSSPPSTLTAGTPLTLTCTIAVNNAVDVTVEVDIVWEISTDNGPVTSTSTATSVLTFTSTLSIPVLSTRYTGVTCRATVRRPNNDQFIISSSQGSDSVNLLVEGKLVYTSLTCTDPHSPPTPCGDGHCVW